MEDEDKERPGLTPGLEVRMTPNGLENAESESKETKLMKEEAVFDRTETGEVLSVWGELSIQAIGVQQQVASSDFRFPGQFPSDEGEATRDSGELLRIRRELRRVEIAGGEIKNDGQRSG